MSKKKRVCVYQLILLKYVKGKVNMRLSCESLKFFKDQENMSVMDISEILQKQ